MAQLDKTKQTYLLKWLKQQVKLDRKWLSLSILTGFLSCLLIIAQAFLLAHLLQEIIMEGTTIRSLMLPFLLLIAAFILRAATLYAREKVNFNLGVSIRNKIRRKLLDRIDHLGPVSLYGSTSAGLTTLIVEQVEDLHDFYGKYLPQIKLASMVPIMIAIAVFPINWAAALILLGTAPLIPIFMILVGMGAAEANRKNFKALERLSGYFYDRLRGFTTIRLFGQGENESNRIYNAAEQFRVRTMQVLKLAFLSSGVLEFFSAISIAVIAVYFGFSYLGELNFGHYGLGVSLFAGFFALILAPEFFQPLRDLGTFYHAKAQAIASAENIVAFLEESETKESTSDDSNTQANANQNSVVWKEDEKIVSIEGQDFTILSPEFQVLSGPFDFSFTAPFNLAIIGKSGLGKTSFFNVLLGFLPYQGSLKINGIEFREIELTSWRKQLSWIGQNPYLVNGSIRDNLLLGHPNASEEEIERVIEQAQLTQLIKALPKGVDSQVGEDAVHLSLGQAQRVAIARAWLKPHQLLLSDEPTASLDRQTADQIQVILESHREVNQIMITHQHENLPKHFVFWSFETGQIENNATMSS